MDILSTLLALCAENSLLTRGFPHKELVMWSFDIICVVIPNNQSVEHIVELPMI